MREGTLTRTDISLGHGRWDAVAEKELALSRSRDTFSRPGHDRAGGESIFGGTTHIVV